MPTPAICPACSTTLQLPEDLYGERVRCRRCRSILRAERSHTGAPVVALVRRPDESSAQRRERLRADRDRQLAPERRLRRRIWFVWLALVAGCFLCGLLVSEFFFFLLVLFGVYLPIGLMKIRADIERTKPLRGVGLMRRQIDRARGGPPPSG